MTILGAASMVSRSPVFIAARLQLGEGNFADDCVAFLTPNYVHSQRWVIVPSLYMESQEPCGDWVFEIGDLDIVAVSVTTEHLKKFITNSNTNFISPYSGQKFKRFYLI